MGTNLRRILLVILIHVLPWNISAQINDSFEKEVRTYQKSKNPSAEEAIQMALFESFLGKDELAFKILTDRLLKKESSDLDDYLLRIIANLENIPTEDTLAFLEQTPQSMELAKMFLLQEYYSLGRLEKSGPLLRSLNIITNMLALGPFDNDDGKGFDIAYAPELNLVFSGNYEGKIRPVSWRTVFASPVGRIKPDNFFRPYNNAAGYFAVFLFSESDQQGKLKLGINTSFKVWMNGTILANMPGIYPNGIDQFEIPCTLQKGWNLLLLKSCAQTKGVWQFTIRLSGFSERISQSVDIPKDFRWQRSMEDASPPVQPSTCLEYLQKMTNKANIKARSIFQLAHYLQLRGNTDSRQLIPLGLFEKAFRIDQSSLHATYVGALNPEERNQKNFLELALRINPGLFAPKRELFRYYRSLDSESMANRLLQELLRDFPQERTIRLEAADTLYQKRYFDLASEMIDGIPLKDSAYFSSKASLAFAIGSATQYQESLEKAWALNKLDGRIRERLINLYFSKSETEKAEKILQESIRLIPDSIELLQRSADLDYQVNNLSAAIRKLEQAELICPEDDHLMTDLGKLHFAAGNTSNARTYYNKAVALRPNNSILKYELQHIFPEMNPLLKESRKIEEVYKPGTPIKETTILLNQQVSEIHKDGTSTTLFNLIIYLANDTDIERFQAQNVFYNPQLERVEFVKARVYDQDLRYVEATDIEDYPYGGENASLFYDMRVLQATMPKIRKGNILQIEYVKHHLAQNMYGWNYFGETFALQNYYPIKMNHYSLLTSTDIKLASRMSHLTGLPQVRKTVDKRGQEILTSYFQTNIKKIPIEENMPAAGSFVPRITVSSFTQWQEFGNWLTELYKPTMIPDESVRKLAQELFQGTSETNEMIQRAYDYVSRKIRYVGLEYGINGIQPRQVSRIIATSFGDCKDKASLMTVLLREKGIKAYVALIRTKSKGTYDYQLPLIEAFDHAVCYVAHGKGMVIDGTADYFTFGDLPPSDDVGRVFVLDGKKSRFFELPPSDCSDNRDEITTQISLLQNLGAYAQRKLVKHGVKAAEYRYQYFNTKDHLSSLEEHWNNSFPKALVKNLTYEGMDSLSETPIGTYDILIPDFIRKSGSTYTIKSMFVTTDLLSAFAISPKERSHDIEFPLKDMTEDSVTYKLPAGWKFATVPSDVKEESPYLSYSLSYLKKENTLTVHMSYCIRSSIVPKSEYKNFRAMLLRISAAEERKITIEGP